MPRSVLPGRHPEVVVSYQVSWSFTTDCGCSVDRSPRTVVELRAMAAPTPPKISVGSAIRTRRRELYISQSGLGRLVGKSQQWVCNVEQGRVEPRLDVL